LHDRPHAPQFCGSVCKSTSQPSVAARSQFANPGVHVNPHDTPSHVAVAFARPGHGEHAAPHVAGSTSLAQPDPHAWKPLWHSKVHRPFVHATLA
jgi:hypothetical protein